MKSTIFENKINNTNTWTAQGAIILWGYGTTVQKDGVFPMLLQQIAIDYVRNVSPIYPLNTEVGQMRKINILGSPNGTLTCQGILDPTSNKKQLIEFLKAVGKQCKTEKDQVCVSLTPFGNTCANGQNTVGTGLRFFMTGLELQRYGLSIAGGEMSMVSQPLTFAFTTLEFDTGD